MANIKLGADAHINNTISLLKELQPKGSFGKERIDLAPGAAFVCDPDSNIRGSYSFGKGNFLKLNSKVTGPNRWFTMQFQLGAIDLSSIDVIGVACRSNAPQATTFRFCLRSGAGDDFIDCFFSKEVVSYSKSSVHLDVLQTKGNEDEIPQRAEWRDLIIFFSTDSSDLCIEDLKVFIV